jgi:hypothetical protein
LNQEKIIRNFYRLIQSGKAGAAKPDYDDPCLSFHFPSLLFFSFVGSGCRQFSDRQTVQQHSCMV